ncbi:unnamed protein product [Penicillium nalgiovense]|uniref:Rhodopsin domain-containing protein n=2 Tax=Penicillium nalgiovense TaxID=60175 RepID=A0A9W4MSG5_PENNA|nr:unnamed protein product [Penicillium nalgiovense]CAG7980980.1 unnamed protein product [Penicillium nalgiovense]CAG7989830.1 unnamed protein product [Penicillium nalgiovense]CAG8018325.1 unnamed protein product [Penicillium nalgiovense]CAG8033233.1 unnamed protein product [Penicillium nalgiovense]
MADTSTVAYCGQQLIGVSIAIAAIQIIIVGARFYTRYIQRVANGIDDYLMIPALTASLAQSALYIYLVKRGGVGYHLEYVAQTPSKLVILQKGLYANQILDFPFTIAPAKISILLFYVRIFPIRKFQIFAYIVGAVVLGHGIGVLLAAIFQCSPIAYTWDKTIVGGSCFNQEAFFRYVSPPNILTDILILVMPLPYVWKLHTHVGHKVALSGVFLLGSLGTVASILRMTIFFQESALTDPTCTSYKNHHPQSQLMLIGTSVKLGIWTILESGIIIIAACLPPIWPLVSKILRRQLFINSSSAQQPRPRYSNTPRHVKVGPGFSQIGYSIEGDKPPLNLKVSQAVDSDRNTDEISLVRVTRSGET